MTQPLPWFAFHIAKYLGETMGLDTEGHGAYLLLILHYYATGTAPKDSDRILASITKLSPERWAADSARCRPAFRDDLAHHSDLKSPTHSEMMSPTLPG